MQPSECKQTATPRPVGPADRYCGIKIVNFWCIQRLVGTRDVWKIRDKTIEPNRRSRVQTNLLNQCSSLIATARFEQAILSS